ncbi:hypothetical protein [Hymenobacter properus]|uniref:DUF3471 domain-containing protein n=1 Tax=Hymenobacter properus TaxID=2791026 RepID=A0A931BDW9_9BACT|nr:hypothetical protein [Hymenobacter properus]MBF9140507.1 hypothetical protein [Hymenobacter properus]MBR7719314.1 hypothetical protein [Microvirga sp. SRT04]
MRIFLLVPLLAGLFCVSPSKAQTTDPVPPTFYSTYTYTAYTVYDTTSAGPPTRVSGVGGTLTLRADGGYEKHLSIVASGKPYYFNQTGTYILTGDSIRFAFSDLKGSDVQRGTFRFQPDTRRLSITIFGYPVGNRGEYELVATPPKAPGKSPKARAKSATKRK